MQPLIERRLDLAGYDARALELEGEGPPIVLVHGYADSADTWRRVLDRLARANRAALAIDLPGFGAAAPLRDGPVLPQLDAVTIAAVEYAHEQAGGEVVLGGNSLGGALALRAAERDDLPLRGIVPVAPAGLDMPSWFTLIERDPIVRWVLAAPVPLPEPVLRTAVGEAYRQLAFANPRKAAAEVVRAFTEHHRDRASVNRILANGRRLLPELEAPFRLERIRCPVLLIWGDRDRMVTHRGAEIVTRALPSTTYALLEGVGHCAQVEAAERVAELLLGFGAGPSQRAA
ncbi:MAG TPA: alpha/beta hydrolase [Solirubrobacteraceae bacterium]|nr:alpha/beta hydrolase [Solirubrobacteraceae bacterium]